jgi:hypothetical protein
MTNAAERPAPTTSTTPTVVCVDSYIADLRATDRWAFTFVPSTGSGRFTIYAPTADSYRVGDRYTLGPA